MIPGPGARRSWALALLLGLALGAGLSWQWSANLRHAFVQAHRFQLTGDEGFHCEIISQLSQNGRYSAWSGELFAPIVTTGYPVLATAALVSRVSGAHPCDAGRGVVVTYHLILLALVMFWAWAITGARGGLERVAVALCAWGILHTGWRAYSSSDYYMFGLMGEGAAMAFSIAAVWAASRGKLGWAGSAASLAVLGKPYMMFLPATLGLYALVACVRGKTEVKAQFWRLCAGLAAPWVVWVGWMVWVQGPGVTLDWWIKYPATMRSVNGGGLPAADASIWDGVALRLKELDSVAGLSAWLLAGLGAARARSVLGAFAGSWARGFMLVHALWWLVLTPGIQTRYLSGFFALSWSIAVMALLSMVKERMAARWGEVLCRAALIGLVLGGLAISIAQVPRTFKAVTRNSDEAATRCEYCRQKWLSRWWAENRDSVGVTDVNPLLSYSTATMPDLEVTLLRKTPVVRIRLDQKLPAASLAVVGQFSAEGTYDALLQRGCSPLQLYPGSREGFLRCP